MSWLIYQFLILVFAIVCRLTANSISHRTNEKIQLIGTKPLAFGLNDTINLWLV